MSGQVVGEPFEDRPTATVGKMHIEQDHVGLRGPDRDDRLVDRSDVADDVDGIADLGLHARTEQRVIIDDEHTDPSGHVGTTNSHSVPAPGAESNVARPPTRSMRSRIDMAMPRRSSPISAGKKPTPLSRTKAVMVFGSTSM